MKFVPRYSQVVGRTAIKQRTSSIVRPDETKNTTKFVIVDAVGPGAAAAGLKIGDVVLPLKMSHIVLDGGTRVRFLLEEEHAAVIVKELRLAEMAVQTENATQFVPFDHKDAATSLGENPPEIKEPVEHTNAGASA